MLATFITPAHFNTLIDVAFQSETPRVASSESDLGEPLEYFATAEAVKAKALACAAAGLRNYAFAFWYPSMKGLVLERRVELDPPREGKTFRHSLGGWGLIHIHLYFIQPGSLQCRVAFNSRARAQSREDRYPELGAAADWDWRVVESCAYRLSRRLSTMGPTATVVQ